MEGYVGEIRHFAANYAPRNWAFCNGQIHAIRAYTPLFAIIGNIYGGDGSNTFQLPNFAGRVAVGVGQAPNLSNYVAGQLAGSNSVTLTNAQLPAHTHTSSTVISLPAYPDSGNSNTPNGNILASLRGMYNTVPGDDEMKPSQLNVTVSIAGQNQPLSITQPTIGMNYIICLNGLFPTRPS